MTKKIILLACILASITVTAQVNIQEIFKMQLFLNKKSFIKLVNTDYKVFSEAIVLKIDILNIENNLIGSQDNNYGFYKATIFDIKQTQTESKPFDVSCYQGSFYILAINQDTGMSYRLSGFEINDFIGFYNDFNADYNDKNLKTLKIRNFLKDYKVENLDFNCLYKGLTSTDKIDRKKHPCLKKCEDSFKIGSTGNVGNISN